MISRRGDDGKICAQISLSAVRGSCEQDYGKKRSDEGQGLRPLSTLEARSGRMMRVSSFGNSDEGLILRALSMLIGPSCRESR
jgi:hypothetical protein